MNPLVSVVIGTYNRQDYVEEALDSVFVQTYPNLEVIVVDDASTDGTLEKVKAYGERIRLIERSVNSGVCQVTRNMGTKAARGTYIAYLDSDDAWYPEKLTRQVELLEGRPDVPLCHTYCHVINEHSEVTGVRHEGLFPPTGHCFADLIRQCFITISSVMVRASLFDEVGYFDEDIFWRIGEDYEFFLRVAKRYPIGAVPEVLARYRKSAAGITAGNWEYTPKVVPIHEWLLRRRDRWEGSVSRSQVVSALVDACLENCQYWRDRGFPGRAMHFGSKAMRRRPLDGRVLEQFGKSVGRLFTNDRQVEPATKATP